MSSEARIAANRLNAQKSTGPRTAEGKAAVAQNAVKHGLPAQADVIRGEDQAEFDLYREELFWELNPVGTMESRLAERIVSLAWRLRRAERIQNEAFDALLTKETSSPLARLMRPLRSKGADQPPDDSDGCDGEPAMGRTVVRDFANARVLDRLLMYERRIESSLYRTMNELRKLQHEQESQVSATSRSRNRRYSAKQSQFPPADDGVRSVLAGASVGAGPCARPGQPQGVAPTASSWGPATGAADFTKQSQSPPGDGVHGTPCESGDANADNDPPEGGTRSGGERAKQSQSPSGDGVHGTACERGDVPACPENVTDMAWASCP